MRTRGISLTDVLVLLFLGAVMGGLLFAGCQREPAEAKPEGDAKGTAAQSTGTGKGPRYALVGPALAQALEIEKRARCRDNLRRIGQALKAYAADHDGDYPPLVDVTGDTVPAVDDDGKINTTEPARSAFAVLLKMKYLTTTRVFVCPSSSDRPPDHIFPRDYPEADLDELLFGRRNCSYGWDPTKRATAWDDCAVIADAPANDLSPANEGMAPNNSDNHRKAGQNVWYNDGHVQWQTTTGVGSDPDIYLGDRGYERSDTDAKIIR